MTTPTTPNDPFGGGRPAANRPGSPVRPLAHGAPRLDTPPGPRPHPTDPHRLWRIVVALVVVAAALGGFAIAYAVSRSQPSTAASVAVPLGGSNGLKTSNPGEAPTGVGSPSGAGAGSPAFGNSGGANFGSGNSGTGSGNSGSGGFGFPGFGQPPSAGGSGNSGAGSSVGSGSPPNVAAIATKVSPALVDINVTFGYVGASGAGTGIVLTSRGEVLTNNHVINGATSISVVDVGNGKTYHAVVKGYDRTRDIAVIQLEGASGLATATIGNSAGVVVGGGVVAVGNAGGSGGTPSSAGGSITGVNQAITARDDLDGTSEQLAGLLATNADVQPGDSGGALADAHGAVVGMTTAGSSGFSFSGTSGRGFAIPIAEALGAAKTIESGRGTSTIHVGATALLGIRVLSRGSFGGATTPKSSGATVSSVVAGSAAARAGLAAGDTITSLGGRRVASPNALSELLVPHHPGDGVVVGYTDSAGKTHSTTVTLASGPPA